MISSVPLFLLGGVIFLSLVLLFFYFFGTQPVKDRILEPSNRFSEQKREFFFSRQELIRSHLKSLISDVEGRKGASIKSDIVLRVLEQYFLDDTKIDDFSESLAADIKTKYILIKTEEKLRVVDALYAFERGEPELYLALVRDIDVIKGQVANTSSLSRKENG